MLTNLEEFSFGGNLANLIGLNIFGGNLATLIGLTILLLRTFVWRPKLKGGLGIVNQRCPPPKDFGLADQLKVASLHVYNRCQISVDFKKELVCELETNSKRQKIIE